MIDDRKAMNINKVIYIRYLPLTAKIYKDFYFKEVIDAGIEIEYWDITDLFNYRSSNLEDSSYLCTTIKFSDYKMLENKMRIVDPEKTIFITIMTLSSDQTKLYKLFLKYNFKVGIFGAVPFPTLLEKRTFISRISNLRNINLKALRKCYESLKYNHYLFGGKKPFIFDVIFSAGKIGYLGIGNYPLKLFDQTKIININYSDYEIARDLPMTNKIIPEDYILFIDQYLPLHPDAQILGIKNINAQNYYKHLNHFFDKIEQIYNLKIIIAAHPKALKYKEFDFFNARQVFFNRTAELTRDSKFVIMHYSTSYLYPVFFKKRIIFISSHEIENSLPNIHKVILNLASSLNAKYYYFDESNNEISYSTTFNEDMYNNILSQRFMNSDNPNKKTSDIFIDYLRK